MENWEFNALEIGKVVYSKREPEEYYVIDSEDVFGCTSPEQMVYGAHALEGSKCIRISRTNKDFWFVRGRIMGEE